MRDAKLPDKDCDTMDTWSHGTYEYDEVTTNMRKLERPVPGRGGATHLTGFSGFQEEGAEIYFGGSPGATDRQPTLSRAGTSVIFMSESLSVLPESFDDARLDEVEPFLDDPEIFYVAGNMSNDIWLNADEAVSIFANYGQVRKYLHNKVLGRGFNGPQRPPRQRRGAPPPPRAASGQQRSPGNTARPKRCSKKFLISRSICARCGKKGHWARECTNPLDEHRKMRAANSGNHFMTIEDLRAHHCNGEPNSISFFTATADDEDEELGTISFQGAVFVLTEGELETFIGLSVDLGFALIDTGAQHGVLGPLSYKRICDFLARFGLKPRVIPTLKMNAVGIGGSSAFQTSAEIPVAIAGVSGTLTIHVVPQEIPLLIPVGFL